MKFFGKDQELGVKETPLTLMALGTGGAFLGLSTGVFNLTEALLLIIAISTTTDAVLDYFGQELKE